jgi:hypothetical protein
VKDGLKETRSGSESISARRLELMFSGGVSLLCSV